MPPSSNDFAGRLIAWQQAHGRHDLPWQHSRDPYRVWLSEIMLQQTQVATVIPYYLAFLERFPDIAALAAAPLDDVLAAWSGLGYYTRARNLQKAAQQIVAGHGGVFPDDVALVEALPGIGRSTAAAICAFSFGQRRAILDGNVKRVLARWLGVDGYPGDKKIETRLWAEAEALLPAIGIEAYTQAQMDLGSLICTRGKPRCDACPVSTDCVALRDGLTAVLPAPKPRKAIPSRATVMLLAWDGDRLLLTRRPPSGIWGGLWCLPEVASTLDAETFCTQHGLTLLADQAAADFEHVFTHFRLTITPHALQVARGTALAAEPDWDWFTREQALAAGIPQPLRKLLSNPQASLF
ncbi:A/G-specific adenine glycosylase [Chitinivorax sp. PXF-14]|uniref:A/G-specific adenine glycosylase n=1 Tax=Chitinivorax sp. PXF-14 TaxID=3230488 RepID=UPI0034672157